jgi:hypothetical protein
MLELSIGDWIFIVFVLGVIFLFVAISAMLQK